MRKIIGFTGLGLIILISTFPSCCKKGEVPTLTTAEVTGITSTTAVSGGTITDEGSGTIVERGVCWSKGTNPTIADDKTTEGGGAGTFISNISDLDPATTYYVRAYATNDEGTGYGMAMSFTTLIPVPTSGLIAYYPFNGNANDESGNNLNGTVYDATLTTDRNGASNKAYYFNGSSSYIKVLHNTFLNLPTYTIAVWVSAERFTGSSQPGGEILVKGLYPNYNYALGAGSYLVPNTFNTATISNGTYVDFRSTNSFNTNTWYLFVVTNDGSNLKIFIDTVFNGSISVGTIGTNNNDIYLGRYEENMNWHYKGKIDDIRIYNRALNTDEILSLYNEIP
jgi:hypothetical protein